MITLDRAGMHRLVTTLREGAELSGSYQYAQAGIDLLAFLLDPQNDAEAITEEETEADLLEEEPEEEVEEEAAAEAEPAPCAAAPTVAVPAEEPTWPGSPWNGAPTSCCARSGRRPT
jgi:hypothetical protein